MADGDIALTHYAVAFIDLLGQRRELEGDDLLPEREEDALALARLHIDAVLWLHRTFDDYYEMLTSDSFTPTSNPELNEIRTVVLKHQRFSDGLVFYVPLSGPPRPEIINGLYGLVATAGALCLLGLIAKRPIRGGVAVAWGAEINGSELYGRAMARAYELESEIAQQPRVVVSDHLIQYLKSVRELQDEGSREKYTKALAEVTLALLGDDLDGVPIVDYLGDGYREYIAKTLDAAAYDDAAAFIQAQVDRWGNEGNELRSDLVYELN